MSRGVEGRPPTAALLAVAAAAVLVATVAGYNVDVTVPVVKYGPRSMSYFGFSVAQHGVWQRHNNRSLPVVLVGAPRDNVSLGSSMNVERPGAVYSCPLTSLHNDCTQLAIDHEALRSGEDTSNQWMGVAVASQRSPLGRALACAHRRRKRGEAYEWGVGLCISMTNALDEDGFWEPCEGKPKSRGHGEYGYCQAGTSAVVDSSGEMLFGAPGSYNWRGNLFSNVLDDGLHSIATWRQSPVEDALPGTFMPRPATSFYSYLGMSVEIGNIIDNEKTFIAGAPRSKNTGQVLLFQPTSDGMTVIPQHYLSGEQFGSGFGYDIAVSDFDSDGKQDLAVSAPFYHAPMASGAVYVYSGKQGIKSDSTPTRILSRDMRDDECSQLNCHNAWFGLSLATPGDIDQDGYEDLIVGAPFEGSGAVYVFRGSPAGLHVEYSQRIAATDLSRRSVEPLTAFGYSLSAGADVDDNGYPDVVVGAFQSDAVVVLRSRPVVNVMTTLRAYPKVIDPTLTQCRRDGLPYNCFKLQACLRFTVNPADRFIGTMDVDLTLEPEKFAGTSVVRAFFLRDNEETHVYNETLTMNQQTDPQLKCTDVTAYLIRNNRDFLHPIRFLLRYKLTDVEQPTMRPGDPLPDLNLYPIINDSLSQIHYSVDFIKNCGNDSECDSNLLVRGILQLDRDETGQYVLKVGQDRELRLFIRVRNRGEDAHEASVNIILPPLMEYLGTDSDQSCALNEDDTITCDVGNPLPSRHEASFGIRLNTDKLESTTQQLEIVLIVNTTSNELDSEDNMDVLRVKVIIETDLAIEWFSKPNHVFYGGHIVGESAMNFLEDTGPEVIHGYEITYKGSGNVRNTRVVISWPYELQSTYASGKHLLYLTQLPQVRPSGYCTAEEGKVNPLSLYPRPDVLSEDSGAAVSSEALHQNASDSSRRHRRQTVASSGYSSGIVTLDCESGSARCCSILCEIDRLPATGSVVITVTSRLWNSTFLEEFTDVRHVDIVSKAELQIHPSLNIRQLSTHNDVTRASTRAFPDIQVRKPAAAPLWAIILSICVGILILLLIILLLCKCGFFRRRRKDDIGFYTAKKVKQQQPLNYFDVD